MTYKLGSFFDGSGGFPRAGTLCGVEPVWASEVEPYPIAVTKSRFPKMLHLGDITKVNGAEIEPVDVITFGSPCQDLSVAGKRAGLKHEENGDDETTRSGLFMESIRIIKEMRCATNGAYPRFAFWENVPGAFSSNKGEDFRIVLEELIKIVEPTAKVPSPDKNGWPYADVYVGDGWSLAYRTFDAQYWGVPQRRRRIHLVAYFGGECAGKILFEREGLRGDFAQSRTPWQGVAADAQRGIEADDREGIILSFGFPLGFCPENTKVYDEVATTICNGTRPGFTCGVIETAVKQQHLFENHSQDTRYKGPLDVCPMLPAQLGTGGNNTPFVVETEPIPIHDQATRFSGKRGDKSDGKGNGLGVGSPGDPMNTLTSADRHAVAYWDGSQTCGTLTANNAGGNQRMPDKENFNCVIEQKEDPIVLDRAFYNQGQNAQYDPQFYQDGTVPTLVAKGPSAVCEKKKLRYIVRRLTPTECARLQGFPDDWGHPDAKTELTDEEFAFWHEVRNTHERINGKKIGTYSKEQMLKWYNKLHTDSAEYKMWGNGICIYPAMYCMQGIVDALNERCYHAEEH